MEKLTTPHWKVLQGQISAKSDKDIPAIVRGSYTKSLIEIDPKMAPIKPDDLKVLLGRLRLHYGMPVMDQGQWRLFWQDYASDLGHLPFDVLEQAVNAWRRSEEKYFPKPGEILGLVRSQNTYRLRKEYAALVLDRQRRAELEEHERVRQRSDPLQQKKIEDELTKLKLKLRSTVE